MIISVLLFQVKHYGAFGEDYLGYSDPTKDLRKAVKQKEKAAKKARKAKKKKTGKKEDDLFDPENLAKFKVNTESQLQFLKGLVMHSACCFHRRSSKRRDV